jgi:hypothetical protein
MRGAHGVVPGDLNNQDCRTAVCKHNENTDLIAWKGAIWFVHRTAGSQILGPNSSLRLYRSRNGGRTFRLQAIVPAPVDRDIRDPSFYSSASACTSRRSRASPASRCAMPTRARSRSRPTRRTVGGGRARTRSGPRAGGSGG